MVMRVNQNIEVTTVLNSIRETLSAGGCKENLAGFSRVTPRGQITQLNEVLKFLDGTSTVNEKFSTKRGEGKNWSVTGLELAGFSLDPKGLGETIRPDRTYLLVHFLRGELNEELQRTIRLYTKETNGVITDCSLVPFVKNQEQWQQVGAKLKFLGSAIGVGTQDFSTPLNIEGGVFSTAKLVSCSPSSLGLLQFNESAGHWTLCTRRGVISLLDKGDLK